MASFGTTKKKIRAKRKKTVTKTKTVNATSASRSRNSQITKSKTVKRGYRGGGHTRTKVKNISVKRAGRVQRRYSK